MNCLRCCAGLMSVMTMKPDFFVDENALAVGTRTMASLAVNFLSAQPDK